MRPRSHAPWLPCGYGGGVAEPSGSDSARRQDLALRALAAVLLVGVGLGLWAWWSHRRVVKAPSVNVVTRPGAGAQDVAPPRLSVGTGSLRLGGYVVDGAGVPVAAVEVAAEPEPEPGEAAEPGGLGLASVVSSPTSADGSFALEGLGQGAHRVRVAGAGIFSSEVSRVEVPGEALTIVVARKVSISGRVIERGQPVIGAHVLITSDVIGGTALLRSGPGGAFTLPVAPEGSYQVLAYRGESAAPVRSVLRLGAGPFPALELVLEPAALVRGRVVVQPTRPGDSAVGVAAALELRPLADNEPARYAQSAADGQFLLEGVRRGRWVVSVVAPGYVLPEPVEIDAGAGPLELTVVAGGAIEGRVVDGGGRPLANVAVRALRAGSEQELSGEREQSLLAHFGGRALVAAAAWDAQVAARRDPRFVPRGELGVLLGPIPLIPPPGARPARRAQLDGAELAPELAQLARPPTFDVPEAARSRWVSDEQGRFVLRGLTPGRYTLRARSPSQVEARRAGLVVTAGATQAGIELVLPAGTVLRGVVRSSRGAPVVGARVVASAPEAAEVETQTGGDGSYRLPPVAGVVRLEVSAPAHASASRRVDTGQVAGSVSAERTEDFSLVSYDAVISGVVDDARGAPVAGARVTIEAGPAKGRSAVTASDGTFRLEALPPQPARLYLEHAELPAMQVQAEPSRSVRAVMAFGGGIAGRVLDDAGLPLASVRVVASGPAGTSAEDATGKDGGFSFTALRPGTWRLAAQKSGLLPASRTLTVSAGAARGELTVREVVLTLARTASAGGTVRDARGGRVAEARVVVRGAGGQVAEGLTDARGEFRLRDCPTGELELTVEHASGRARQRLYLRPGDEVATLALELTPP